MVEPRTIYIDCNRQNSAIKSEELKNEWVNVLSEPLKLNAGSTIQIQNSFVNYKGLSGGSVELLEDYNITMTLGYYISHTDIMAIKNESNNSAYFDDFYNDSGLYQIYYKFYDEHGYHNLMSPGLYTKLSNNITTENSPSSSFRFIDEIESGVKHGYTEQPLCAVVVNSAGYIAPLIDNVEINITKGIYGITELGENIQDQINGVRKPFKSNKFNETQIDYFNGNYKGGFTSQLTTKGNYWRYEEEVGGVYFTSITDILNNANTAEMVNFTEIEKKYLFITNEKFSQLLTLWKSGQFTNPEFQWETFRDNNYIFVIKNTTQYKDGIPELTGGNRWYNPSSNTILSNGYLDTQNYFNYNPYLNGYYLGTTNFLLNYDTTKSGFSIQYLHEPRRQPSHDALGNKNEQEGQTVSFMKSWNATDFCDKVGLTTSEKNKVINTLLNPRQRFGGVFIINWDEAKALETSGKTTLTDPHQAYYNWIDYFNNDENKAKEAWLNTLWSKLGFTYEQLADTKGFEIVHSYDLNPSTMVGTTTNNQLDISINNTIAGKYCPLIGVGSSPHNRVNPDLPYVIADEVQMYGIDDTSKGYFKINKYNYESRRNVYYMSMDLFPVLTQSNAIIAKFLPDLSEQGYFLITSDIIDGFRDVVKKGDPIALLGVVPKSSLSNQDFISSFQEITHITSQDQIINQIKIKILNPDLTNPDLNSKSSVILKIVNNIPESKK